MSGKPFQSCLIPYLQEIAALRSERPPVSYARIAELLQEKHGLSIQRAAIAKFVKVRSGGRKAYVFRRQVAVKRSAPIAPVSLPMQAASPPAVVGPVGGGQEPAMPRFEFKYSERYNLKRLPKEEAAAIRKKLEEQGH